MLPTYGVTELKKVVSEILWVRAHFVICCRQYPMLVDGKSDTAPVIQSMLDQPLKFFLQTEGPERDPTWIQSLPNEAL